MNYSYTILYVADVVASIEFYQQALGLELKFLHDSNEYAELNTGNTTLAFASEGMAAANTLSITPNRKDTPSPAFELGFVVDDVSAAVEKAIHHGATVIQEPSEKPWGQTVAHLSDINGVIIELCTAIQ